MGTWELSQFGAMALVLGIMLLGEFISKITKGKVPSALIISVIMLVGFWTVFPSDLVERMGITDLVYSFCAMFVVINLATLISKKEMIAQWKTVIISLVGLIAIIAVTLGVSSFIFGWSNAVAATPPLTGGAIATMMISQAAIEKGLQSAALIALIIMVLQGLVGYPLTSIFLGKEAKRLNEDYKSGKLQEIVAIEEEEEKTSIFTKIKAPPYILFKFALIALVCVWLEIGIMAISGGKVNLSRYLWCLVIGFFASEFKFLEKDALTVGNSNGLLNTFLLIYVFGMLHIAEWDQFIVVLIPSLCFVLIAAIAMGIAAFIMSKVFKTETFGMCYCIILNAFYGFPINITLTNEAIEGATEDPEARLVLNSIIMPKMLLGGFTSVTIVSVIVAGILIPFL